jgi:hypothetical protein
MDATCTNQYDTDQDDTALCMRRRKRLLTRLKGREGPKIVCIPARFKFTNPDPLEFRSVISDYWYVVADGEYHGVSFVARACAEPPGNVLDAALVKATSPEGNQVKLWPLS